MPDSRSDGGRRHVADPGKAAAIVGDGRHKHSLRGPVEGQVGQANLERQERFTVKTFDAGRTGG
jgi:hypothetical protein